MPCLATVRAPAETIVGMGQSLFASEPSRLMTILGSCVAVALYSPRRRLGMLSHVVLPQSRGGADNPAKFADTAVPHMLAALRREGIGTGELVAKIAGGACMFGDGQFSRIGDNNVRAAIEALAAAGIRLAAQDTGGKKGRRVSFDLASGAVTVASVGCSTQII